MKFEDNLCFYWLLDLRQNQIISDKETDSLVTIPIQIGIFQKNPNSGV